MGVRQVNLRVTDTELEQIKEASRAAGLSQNRWLRSRVLGTPDGSPGTPDGPVGESSGTPAGVSVKKNRVALSETWGR